MNEKHDIEAGLKAFRYEARSETRERMVRAFEEAYPTRSPLWKRPVPAYGLAALLVLGVAISFFVGQRMAATTADPLPAATNPPELEWSYAESDLLRAS